jgi:hypothetical protein
MVFIFIETILPRLQLCDITIFGFSPEEPFDSQTEGSTLQNATCTVKTTQVTISAAAGSTELVTTTKMTCNLSVENPSTAYWRGRNKLRNAVFYLNEVHDAERKDDEITVILAPHTDATKAIRRIKQIIKEHGFYVEPQASADT